MEETQKKFRHFVFQRKKYDKRLSLLFESIAINFMAFEEIFRFVLAAFYFFPRKGFFSFFFVREEIKENLLNKSSAFFRVIKPTIKIAANFFCFFSMLTDKKKEFKRLTLLQLTFHSSQAGVPHGLQRPEYDLDEAEETHASEEAESAAETRDFG